MSRIKNKIKTLSFIAAATFILNSPIPTLQAESSSIVEIKRDAYGVPHIFADDTYSLFFGYGYAVAQDRLFQIDMARRSFTGRTAEVLGAGENNKYIDYDIYVRSNYSPSSIQAQIDALEKTDRDIFQGYADGFNAYLQKINQTPQLLPKEYLDFDFTPEPLTAFDVVMIWVGSMANRFSDVNDEINGLGLLKALEDMHGSERGQAIFNELRWIHDPTAPTTVPQTNPSPLQKAQSKNTTQPPIPSQSLPFAHEVARSQQALQNTLWGGVGPDFAPKTSNLWVTQPHRVKENKTVLINGPQFGWFNPSYTYGVGLHGAGFDVIGSTPFAYPIILFGTNGTIGWGATAGPQDVVDIYQITLDPERENYYLFEGEYRPMESRQETISVRDAEDVPLTIYRTVHGFVIERDPINQVAYAKKRSWEGYEVQSLLAWLNIAKAKNWDDVLRLAQNMAISINWYYADKEGNIGYVSPGFLPKRPNNQDIRIPALGDGSMEWLGILDFDAIPKAYNPQQGYLTNWNNLPAADKTNTDAYFWTYGDRVEVLNSLYDEKDSFSINELWEFNQKASYEDVNWRFFKPHIVRIAQTYSFTPQVSAMIEHLLDWDGTETDNHGTNMHAGRNIFKTWLEELYQLTLAPLIPEAYQKQYTQTLFPTPDGPNGGSVNLSMGTKVLLRALANEQDPDPNRFNLFENQSADQVMSQALNNTYQRLQKKWGSNIKDWKLPTSVKHFYSKNFTGIPQTTAHNEMSFNGFQNRGTANTMIILDAHTVELCDVNPPGQSGFISPSGEYSPHYDDQMQLYKEFGCKTVAWDKEKIAQTTRNHIRLKIVR